MQLGVALSLRGDDVTVLSFPALCCCSLSCRCLWHGRHFREGQATCTAACSSMQPCATSSAAPQQQSASDSLPAPELAHQGPQRQFGSIRLAGAVESSAPAPSKVSVDCFASSEGLQHALDRALEQGGSNFSAAADDPGNQSLTASRNADLPDAPRRIVFGTAGTAEVSSMPCYLAVSSLCSGYLFTETASIAMSAFVLSHMHDLTYLNSCSRMSNTNHLCPGGKGEMLARA